MLNLSCSLLFFTTLLCSPLIALFAEESPQIPSLLPGRLAKHTHFRIYKLMIIFKRHSSFSISTPFCFKWKGHWERWSITALLSFRGTSSLDLLAILNNQRERPNWDGKQPKHLPKKLQSPLQSDCRHCLVVWLPVATKQTVITNRLIVLLAVCPIERSPRIWSFSVELFHPESYGFVFLFTHLLESLESTPSVVSLQKSPFRSSHLKLRSVTDRLTFNLDIWSIAISVHKLINRMV